MPRPNQPRRRVHPFAADPDMPADPYSGRAICARCSKPGQAGDAQHPPDAPPGPSVSAEVVAAARARDAAILGERDRDG